jgi:AsmA protein
MIGRTIFGVWAMRTGKILGLVVGGLIALCAIALVALWLLVDPNHYKPRIAAAVKDATGRDLVLQGDLKLSVFPWIALELGPASLGNPAGFNDEPFVSFQHAAVRARLWPLLRQRLEIGRIEIDGLDLRLQKNAEGRGNWEGFGRADATPANPARSGQSLPGIAGIQISGARVSYQQLTLESLNVETGPFAEHGVVPIALRFDANRGVAGEHANVTATFDFSGDFGAKRYRIAALNLHALVNLAGDDRPVRWDFSTPTLDADVEAQTLSAPAFGMDLAGAKVSGSLQGSKIIDDLNASGSLTLAPLVVREFLPRLGITGPRTRDPRALSLVSASGNFVYGGNAARVDELQLTLDDTHLKGNVVVVDLERQAVKFELAADRIDVDRYLGPEGRVGEGRGAQAEAGKSEAARAEAATRRANQAAKSEGPKEAAKEAAKGRPLEASGTLRVGSLHLAPLDLTNLKLTLAATGGVMHVFPLTAQIDGGQYSGDVTLDSRGSTPVLSMDEHLTGVEVGQLLATNPKNVHLSGRGNVNLKATGRGDAADALMKTLNGHVEAYLSEGAVEGIDLGYELGRAEALIRRQEMPATQNTRRTQFDAFKVSAVITNGIAVTNDLVISSQALKVTGQGSANIPTQAIDFAVLADTLRTAGNTPIQVPVKITGTVSDPTVRPDIEALAKGQLKQKLQDVLGEKLKGLFGKP